LKVFHDFAATTKERVVSPMGSIGKTIAKEVSRFGSSVNLAC
jgi:hypothetical protein